MNKPKEIMIDLCVAISLAESRQVVLSYLLYVNALCILMKCYTGRLNSFSLYSQGKLLSGAL